MPRSHHHRQHNGIATVGDVEQHAYLSVRKAIILTLSALSIVSSVAMSGGYLIFEAGNGAWVCMAIATAFNLCVAVALSVFARLQPAGSTVMDYLSTAFGPWARQLVGASSVLGFTLAAASTAPGAVMYASAAASSLGFDLERIAMTPSVLVAVMTAGAVALTIRGLDASARVVAWLIGLSAPILIAITGAAIWKFGIHFEGQLKLTGVTSSNILAGASMAMVFYIGFDGCAAIGAQTADPAKYTPRILFISISLVGVLTTVCGCLLQVPILDHHLLELQAGVPPIALIAEASGVGFLATPLNLLFAGASFSALVALVNFGSRIVAMSAADGYLPAILSRCARNGAPRNAALALGAISAIPPALMIAVGGMTPLMAGIALSAAVVYFWVPSYSLVCIGILKLYRRDRSVASPLQALCCGAGAFGIAVLATLNFVSGGSGAIGVMPIAAVAGMASLYLIFRARERPVETPDLSHKGIVICSELMT